MSWVNIQYKSNLRNYGKRDGLKAFYTVSSCAALSFKAGLYNKCKCFRAKFIADMDSIDFGCRILLFLRL